MYIVKDTPTKYKNPEIISRINRAKGFIRAVEGLYQLPAFTLVKRNPVTNRPLKRWEETPLMDLKQALVLIFILKDCMRDGEIAEAFEMDRTSIITSRRTAFGLHHVKDEKFLTVFRKIQGVWNSFYCSNSLQNVNSPYQSEQHLEPNEHSEFLKRSA